MEGRKIGMASQCRGRWLVALLAVALSPGTAALEFAETIVKRGAAVEGDLYIAGRTVEIATEVRGDLVAAAQHLNVTRAVSEDLIVVGETLHLNGPVGDDVRAAGRLITLSAPLGGHLVAAGGQITLSAGASTGSWAWLAGRVLQVLGDVGGELKAAGQEVVIGGTVEGDVTVYAERIRVLEGAQIRGAFAYGSEQEPQIADGARIDGDIRRIPLPDLERRRGDLIGAAAGAGILLTAGLFLVGAVHLLLFPGLAAVAGQTASRRPWASLGLGLAILFLVPVLVMILLASVIGAPLALALLALYAVLLLFGYVHGAAWLGELVLRHWRKAALPGRVARLLALAVMLVVLALLQLVPVFGALTGMAVGLIGSGSLGLGLVHYYRAAAVGEAA
jgi:cytoskeletal protein CcmA (bactofilin family)